MVADEDDQGRHRDRLVSDNARGLVDRAHCFVTALIGSQQVTSDRPANCREGIGFDRGLTGENVTAVVGHRHRTAGADVDRTIGANEIGLIDQRHRRAGEAAVPIGEAARHPDQPSIGHNGAKRPGDEVPVSRVVPVHREVIERGDIGSGWNSLVRPRLVVAVPVGPPDRHQHQRALLYLAECLVGTMVQCRGIGSRHGQRRLEIGTDELDFAQRPVDRLEGQRGVLRQHVGVILGAVGGVVDLGTVAGTQVGEEEKRNGEGEEYSERADREFRTARESAHRCPQRPRERGLQTRPQRCRSGPCHDRVGASSRRRGRCARNKEKRA
jgi:hypothetical protein